MENANPNGINEKMKSNLLTSFCIFLYYFYTHACRVRRQLFYLPISSYTFATERDKSCLNQGKVFVYLQEVTHILHQSVWQRKSWFIRLMEMQMKKMKGQLHHDV